MKKLMYFFLLILVFPYPVYAMHISEGILPLNWAGLWFLLSIPFIWKAVRIIEKKEKDTPSFKPFLGMVGAVVFLISCMPIPVPTAGTCSHPCGTGLAALLIGPFLTVFVTSIALLIQALFLAHGGLTTLGADIISMGVVGAFSAYFVFKLLRKFRCSIIVSAFIAGLISDWATYSMTSFELASALHGNRSVLNMFWPILIAFIPTQLPLGILEGFMTAGVFKFILDRRPDILMNLGVDVPVNKKKSAVKSFTVIVLAAGLFLASLAFTAPVIASSWAGVDETIVEKYAAEAGRPPREPFINTDQGDLLLFVFLIAGIAGGFVVGYYYRMLFSEKSKLKKMEKS